MISQNGLEVVISQNIALMETTKRHRAGESGLPLGLSRCCLKHWWPKAKICMPDAVSISVRTSLTTLYLLTLRRRHLHPLMKSPGFVGSAWVNQKGLIIVDIFVGTEAIKQHEPEADGAWRINACEKSNQILIVPDKAPCSGAFFRMRRRAHMSPEANGSGQTT